MTWAHIAITIGLVLAGIGAMGLFVIFSIIADRMGR